MGAIIPSWALPVQKQFVHPLFPWQSLSPFESQFTLLPSDFSSLMGQKRQKQKQNQT